MATSKFLFTILSLSLLTPTLQFANFTIQPGQSIVIKDEENKADYPDGDLIAICRWGIPTSALGYGAAWLETILWQSPYTMKALQEGRWGAAYGGPSLQIGFALGAIVGVYRNYQYTNAYHKNNGLTIHASAAKNNVPGIRAWFESGAESAHYPDSDSRLPMHYAAGAGALDAIDALYAEFPIDFEVNYKDKQGNTPALIAAKCAQYKALQKLLALGARDDIQDEKGVTLKDLAKQDATVQKLLDQRKK